MNNKDIIKLIGRFPNAINPPKRLQGIWTCSKCGYTQTEVKTLSQVDRCECGSIFWEIRQEGKINGDQRTTKTM
jgi:hypothetical protein